MADAYLRWKYGYDVSSKPTSPQPPSSLPAVDGVMKANTPFPTKSATSNPNCASVDDTVSNTLTIHASANGTPTDDTLTITPPADVPADPPPTNDTTSTPISPNFIPPHLSNGTGGDGPSSHGVDVEIAVIDIYTLSTLVRVSSAGKETTASALADLGFIGNVPFKPSVTVSMKTLELYQMLRQRKASFSIEAFVKVISDLYLVFISLVVYSHYAERTNRYPTAPNIIACLRTHLTSTLRSSGLSMIV